MQTKLQKEIDELRRQLENERKNMAGNAQELREKMQAEIDDLKK